jgi:hypothetical protein
VVENRWQAAFRGSGYFTFCLFLTILYFHEAGYPDLARRIVVRPGIATNYSEFHCL